MTTPTETYPLPAEIPTVEVTGMYRGLNGRGLAGSVTFTGPPLLTFADSDLFVGGNVVAKLDPYGKFTVRLPATDSPDMSPTGWAYTVKENLTNVTGSRTFSMVLPADTPGGTIDLADVAPSDPAEYTYVPVAGDSAYEVAVANGYAGTEAEWLASLKGDAGAPGVVQSVNGYSAATVTLSASDVGALAESLRGAPGGVASLGLDGLVPASQLPEGTGGGGFNGILNVRDYGAVGDGVADDAPAIQAALDDAANDGAGWVLIPPGVYLCATLPLRTYGDTRVTALGATLLRGAVGTFLTNGDSGASYSGYDGHGNLLFEGGVWDMRAGEAPYDTDPDMCMSIGHARNVTIRDLEIRDVAGYHAIELNSTKHALIDNCKFRGYVDTGSRAFSEAVQFDGAFRVSVFGAFGSYDGTPCEDITMRDCYVGPSGTANTVAWPSAVGSHSAVAGEWHKRIRIVNNTSEGGAQYAIKPYIWNESVILGNTVTGQGAGIWARTLDSSKTADRTTIGGTDTGASQPGTGLVIANNVIRNGGSFEDGIFVEGEASGKWSGVTIIGNTVLTTGGTENGVRLVHVDGFVTANNVLEDIGGTALSTALCANGVLAANRIRGCGGSFFTSDSGSFLNVVGNSASDCETHGFWAWSNTNLKIVDNTLRGAGRADASAQGFRLSSSGSSNITVTGNTYRMWGSGTEATTVFYASSAVSGLRRWGNDWAGQGTVSDSSTGSTYSPYDPDKEPV